jgi:RNA polymerase sigma-70 factor (ECF subfamily)
MPDAEPVRAPLAERLLGHLPGLTRFVRRRMGAELASRESASDIVQSTCRELLHAAPEFADQGDASFQRWLRSAAEHKLRNRARYWRAQRRDARERPLAALAHDTAGEAAAPESSHPSHAASLRDEAGRLARAFERLPADYRAVVARSQIDGASHAEIARESGRSPEAVRKLLARAMARFAAELERDTGVPEA